MSPQEPAIEGSEHRDLEATALMCYHCFDVLIREIHGSSPTAWGSSQNRSPSSLPDFKLEDNSVECPLFVTWEKERRGKYELRGCIGTLSPKPLLPSVGQYALTSALRDRRFQPISWGEVSQLRVAVSLLVKYESCSNCFDWEVGIHGILIEWRDNDSSLRTYSATYLPEVARDQGWNKDATIRSLIRKAGYNRQVSDELLQSIRCTRYQSSKLRITYDEYCQFLGFDPVKVAKISEKHSSPPNCRVS